MLFLQLLPIFREYVGFFSSLAKEKRQKYYHSYSVFISLFFVMYGNYFVFTSFDGVVVFPSPSLSLSLARSSGLVCNWLPVGGMRRVFNTLITLVQLDQ